MAKKVIYTEVKSIKLTKIQSETLKIIKNKEYYFIESNHDVGMLLESSRPNLLKRRILSFKGHLSNEQCAYYLVELVGENDGYCLSMPFIQGLNSRDIK